MLTNEELLEHLIGRGLQSLDGVIIGDGRAHFLLYSLSGKLVGYQRYNPIGDKKSHSNKIGEDAKYYTYMAKGENSFWGAHSFNSGLPYIFITEGIFNAVKAQNAGHPCLAMLSSCPSKSSVGFLNMLPQRKIIICDNDGAATGVFRRLRGTKIYPPKKYGDLGDMPQEEATDFLNKIIKNDEK